MKTTCIIFVLFFSINLSFGQSLSVFDVDASNFPTIKAKFFAFDKDVKQILNLYPTDLEIFEDGNQRNETKVSCPVPKVERLSIVFAVDVTIFNDISNAKSVLNAWLELIPLNLNEIAIMSYDKDSYINQDFTTDKFKLQKSISSLSSQSSREDNTGALIRPLTGAISVAKKGKYKPIVVVLSSCSHFDKTREVSIIEEAKKNKVTINFNIFDKYDWTPEICQNIARETGGFSNNHIPYNDLNTAISSIKMILALNKSNSCDIEWQSGVTCIAGITDVEFQIKNLGITSKTSYKRPNKSITKLEFNPTTVKFPNPEVGVKVVKKVTVTARNIDFIVTNIKSNNAAFTIIPKSFVLNAGQSIELTVSYLPTDSGYVFARFDIENDLCQTNYYTSGGFSGIKPKIKTLKLLHPNGGEEFVIGSDTVITWEGIPDSDTVQLEYTIDNGTTWKTITYKASGLQYKWENIPKPPSAQCKVRIKQSINPGGTDNDGDLIHTLSGHKGIVYEVSWSPDGYRVATAGGDNTARIWDAETGDLILTLSGHTDEVWAVSWSPEGSRVATASYDYTARIWDAETGDLIHTLSGHKLYLLAVSWSPNGSRVATASYDNTARIWDATSGAMLHTLIGKNYVVRAVSWSPDGSRVAIVGDDGIARIWDAETGVTLQTLSGHDNGNSDINWSPDGSRVATASYDKTARIWDAETGITLHTLSGHTAPVFAVRWSPNGSRVVTVSRDRTAIIWDVASGATLHTLSGHTDDVRDVSWSPDGSRVATASVDKTARIWDAASGVTLHTLIGHSNRVRTVSWSPDGSRVATASWDNTAKIWDAGGNRELQRDESDNVFNVVAPSPSAIDIDMKQCLIGTTKDSVVVGFIQNTGSYKFRVDSIYFQGADADAFALVSGIPKYVVDANQVHHAEFRFIPNRVGIHSAEIVIVTQAETLIQNIRGEGVSPRLELVNDLIDFGTVEIQNYKDTLQVSTIKNIGNAPIKITNTKHNYPNTLDFTTLAGGGSFTLQPNDTHKMDLRFTANSIGRTSGTLEFHYDGTGSPAVIQLYGQGLGGLIKIDNDSAFAGEKRMLRLRLGNNIKPKSNDLATGFKAVISYNPTLLSCQDVNVTKNYSLLAETIEINGKWDGKSNLLGEFEVTAGLGNADSTKLVIEEFNWLDDNEQPVDYEVEMQNGTFKLLGICYEGGARLINPNNKVELLQISPNPNDGNLVIGLNLIEEGSSTLSIYNSNGQLMYEQNLSGSTGKIDLNIDTKEYGNGLYFVSLQTPTIRKVKQMVVFK